jgi:tRNA threonylcarbamoyladenosine biosynthesis protein TsaE
VTSTVNSPTFVLMNEHAGRLRLYHIDAYRLGAPEEALAAGLLDEREIDGVSVIEWADRLDGWLPADRLDITLSLGAGPTERRLRWEAHGPEHRRLAEALTRS